MTHMSQFGRWCRVQLSGSKVVNLAGVNLHELFMGIWIAALYIWPTSLDPHRPPANQWPQKLYVIDMEWSLSEASTISAKAKHQSLWSVLLKKRTQSQVARLRFAFVKCSGMVHQHRWKMWFNDHFHHMFMVANWWNVACQWAMPVQNDMHSHSSHKAHF